MEAPSPEESAEGLVIVNVLSAVLERLVSANELRARSQLGLVTKFRAMKAPGIAIQQYLERILKYASCSNECFILALIYIDRLIQRNDFLLSELNVHRVVITGILLAAKFSDDAYYNNAYYAKVGGVNVAELNGLEVDFLFRINFSLHVTPEEFGKYRVELLSHAAAMSAVPPPSTIPEHDAPVPVSPEVAPIAVDTYDALDFIITTCEVHSGCVPMSTQLIPEPTLHIVEDSYMAMMHHHHPFEPMNRSNSLPPIINNNNNAFRCPDPYPIFTYPFGPKDCLPPSPATFAQGLRLAGMSGAGL